jgi:hypothetical protein
VSYFSVNANYLHVNDDSEKDKSGRKNNRRKGLLRIEGPLITSRLAAA